MLIWIIGKNGLLGSYLIQEAKKASLPFIATSSDEVDLCSCENIQSFVAEKKPTHIFNCAAYTNVEKAEEEKEQAFLINALAVENLCKSAPGIKIVHFSTDYVFDGSKKEPYLENDPTCPINVYGKSKVKGEEILLSYRKDALIIRISWLYGKKGDFVSKICSLLETKEKLSVVDDQKGFPCYAKEVAKFALLHKDKRGIIHFRANEAISWYDFAQEIFSLQKKRKKLKCTKITPVTSDQFPTKAKRPLYSVLGSIKILRCDRNDQDWQKGLMEYFYEG